MVAGNDTSTDSMGCPLASAFAMKKNAQIASAAVFIFISVRHFYRHRHHSIR
jgi:hypothetical protein